MNQRRPVILVHGIFDSAIRLTPLRDGLRSRGVDPVVSVDLIPSTGQAPLEVLARQLDVVARRVLPQSTDGKLDVVGFSMGALVTRYWLQRLGGKELARKFVSISGPHNGTLTAFAVPLPGPRQMRPRSAFLRDLQADHDPFGSVEVHCLLTPWDAVIVPSGSSALLGARTVTRFPVPMHRLMIRDARVLDHVASLLIT